MRTFFVTIILILTPFHAEATIKIIAFGDSLTEGYNLNKEQAYPKQLESLLKARDHDLSIINQGISGETTAGGLARVSKIIEQKPDAIILCLGGNDSLRGIDPKETYKNLDKIIGEIKTANIKVLMLGMKAPLNFGTEFAAEYNKIFPDLAKKHQIMFYTFALEGVALKSEYNLPDGVHPNEKGMSIIANNLVPYIEKLIK